MRLEFRSWAFKFAAASVGGVAVLVALCWVVFGFGALGLGVHGTIALTLGIVLSVGLGVGLMALIFYSERSGRDDDAGGRPGA